MNSHRQILRISSVAAGISTLMLILMAMIPFPAGISYPGVKILTGQTILSSADLGAYLAAMRALFILDGIFLLGWIVSLVGISELVRPRYRVFGVLTLILGLAGAMFDYAENSIIWGVIQNFQAGAAPGTLWVVSWKAVQHLSYWLPFIGAVLAAIGLWGKKSLDRITAIIGSGLVAIAVIGLYLPGFSLAANLWFLLWFASVSLLLWRRAAEISPNP